MAQPHVIVKAKLFNVLEWYENHVVVELVIDINGVVLSLIQEMPWTEDGEEVEEWSGS